MARGFRLGRVLFTAVALAVAFVMIIAQDERVTGFFMMQTNVSESNIAPEIYFCPTDDCAGRLNDVLRSANKSIHCAIYDVDEAEILDTLREKSEEIDMKLVVDKDYEKKVEGIAHVTNSGTYQLMHDKFCIVDGCIVFTGSYNPSTGGRLYDNNMLIIYSKYISENYEQEFGELLNREFGKGGGTPYNVVYLNGMKIENYFCPEDGCANRLLETIKGAKKSVLFMTFTFTHDGVGDALVEKHDAGVDVRGVFEKFQNGEWSEYERLKEKGVEVRWDTNPKLMHNKVFIIDNETVVTGSFNPTKAADTKNDENLLIIHDRVVAGRFTEEFWRVYGG